MIPTFISFGFYLRRSRIRRFTGTSQNGTTVLEHGTGTGMKIILAAPRGFCAGVNMAIESLDLTLKKFGAPVYVYHEIVHNQYVVAYISPVDGHNRSE